MRMKKEQVLERLERIKNQDGVTISKDITGTVLAVEYSIDAVKKQIPNGRSSRFAGDEYLTCRSCHSDIEVGDIGKYCTYCGQKLRD